jgi:predicted RNA-binding protein with PUA-like domain
MGKGIDMASWLFKEEPDHYSFADLQSDGKAVWDGVSNALALKNLRATTPGDRVFFYHTGKEKAIIGIMQIASAQPGDDGEGVVVEVEPVRKLQHPVSLARIKQEEDLASWELVRLPRLSIVPVTEAQWKRIEEMSRSEE